MNYPKTLEEAQVGDTLVFMSAYESSARLVTVSRLTQMIIECEELRHWSGKPHQFNRITGYLRGNGGGYSIPYLAPWAPNRQAQMDRVIARNLAQKIRETKLQALPLEVLHTLLSTITSNLPEKK
jgi:tryptophan 2,3-dioxygenase